MRWDEMKKGRARYWIPGQGQEEKDAYVVDLPREEYWIDTVEKVAYDFHFNRDGFEASWPVTFHIRFQVDGKSSWSAPQAFEVDRRAVPAFSAKRVDI